MYIYTRYVQAYWNMYEPCKARFCMSLLILLLFVCVSDSVSVYISATILTSKHTTGPLNCTKLKTNLKLYYTKYHGNGIHTRLIKLMFYVSKFPLSS